MTDDFLKLTSTFLLLMESVSYFSLLLSNIAASIIDKQFEKISSSETYLYFQFSILSDPRG